MMLCECKMRKVKCGTPYPVNGVMHCAEGRGYFHKGQFTFFLVIPTTDVQREHFQSVAPQYAAGEQP